MSRRPRVLAVASTGGHWVQLNRLMPAFDGCETHWLTTSADQRAGLASRLAERGETPAGFHVCTDANRNEKLRVLRMIAEVAWILLRVRPEVVVTTGAAPGFVALRLGKLLGARTCWIDSIANAEELSMSGRLAGPHADLFLTQWPEVARPEGPHYRGAVL
jgi:UDP-N-acetylglucosamine:LPS N-acetylglucosamine transferase